MSSGAVQARIDILLKRIYYRTHPITTDFNEKDIGFFTVNGTACDSHTKDNKQCDNCTGKNYFNDKNSWFKKTFPSLPKLSNSVVSGSSGSCCAFAFFCMDYVLRENKDQTIATRDQRKSGILDRKFIEKYVQPGDVLGVGVDDRGPHHYAIVYDVDLKKGTIRIKKLG